MIGYHVERTNGSCDVLLLPHKDGSGYSYVNLTKGHICPCKFNTPEEALQDMESKENIKHIRRVFNLDGSMSSIFSPGHDIKGGEF